VRGKTNAKNLPPHRQVILFTGDVQDPEPAADANRRSPAALKPDTIGVEDS
jgi:hypothetical protein